VLAGVAVDDDEVGVLAGGDAADGGGVAHVGGAVEGGDVDGFEGGETGFDEELDFALIAEAGEDAAVAGGVGAGEQETSCSDELAFEGHAVPEELSVLRGGFGVCGGTHEFEVAGVEVGGARGRGHGVEDSRLEMDVAGIVGLEDRERGGYGYVMRDEESDERLGFGGTCGHLREGGIAGGARAIIGRLAGVELGVDEEAVLEVVDAELGGFGIGDGAEVAGELEAVLVGFIDGGLQLARVMYM